MAYFEKILWDAKNFYYAIMFSLFYPFCALRVLLIFILDGLSRDESGILKSPTAFVSESISSFCLLVFVF